MKNTKMRKKMLISSIAMLMVATVSLGSATYAWFTTSPTATASGLKMKASASNGLKILSATHAENSAASLDDPTTFLSTTYLRTTNGTSSDAASFTMNPISLNAQETTYAGYKVQASSFESKDADDAATVEDATAIQNNATTNTGDYYVEDIHAALVGAADATSKDTVKISNLTITPVSEYAMTSGVRVALYYNDVEDNTGDDKDTKPTITTTTKIGVYALSAGTTTVLKESGKTYLNTQKDENVAISATSTVVNWPGALVDTTGRDYFTVVVYLDGEDTNVKSAGIKASDLITNISLGLTLPTP